MSGAYEPPKALSASSVSTFNQCPLKYRLGRLDKLTEPATAAQHVGSMTHEVLEALMRRPPGERTKAVAKELLRAVWDESWADKVYLLNLGDRGEHEFRWNVLWCVQNYFDIEDPATVEVAGLEESIDGYVGGVPFRGFIDRRIVVDERSMIVQDYKTGKVSPPRYEGDKVFQLMIYAELTEQNFMTEVVDTQLLYLKGSGFRKPYEPTSERRSTTIQTAVETWEQVLTACSTGKFEPRPSRLCDWCSFKPRCPAFTKGPTSYDV